MIHFAVFGLPRSGTTWAANWLTTEHSLCLHDPFAEGLPEHWEFDHRRRGISCTGGYLLPGWLETIQCPVIVIDRDREQCSRSLRAVGLPEITDDMVGRLADVRGLRASFGSLFDEVKARELWRHVLPEVPFDAQRYRALVRMKIEPKAEAMVARSDVIAECLRRGWHQGKE